MKMAMRSANQSYFWSPFTARQCQPIPIRVPYNQGIVSGENLFNTLRRSKRRRMHIVSELKMDMDPGRFGDTVIQKTALKNHEDPALYMPPIDVSVTLPSFLSRSCTS
ncbi:hypothetical protein SERLA73DRAFT_188931 [Serpula lacrymans var. lacrymans S7.3]|uniref:Uncharacterized protein n=2 Tax=Serpula lacrymans var. lacrymans TaxID=341189 RepID=F8QCG1_SERL3|nr:uncharacterized protein SERLADRAFT_479542 [Serpula lacrymans var. lacrymans S7.9]EGN93826.1 hypothetical protein SERLA73DRAFT_188931 [Serpula lacrymans var. lacrymans S7.3]EGO19194.1 hypothetical protein SERLADRAFT_479542 [Serpula lacrymans var. lacrymans S7.9]